MTDLEITKLCAKAMGISYRVEPLTEDGSGEMLWSPIGPYDPLHDDAQSMALVKRFPGECVGALYRRVFSVRPFPSPENELLRVICECVAKMQGAKP